VVDQLINSYMLLLDVIVVRFGFEVGFCFGVGVGSGFGVGIVVVLLTLKVMSNDHPNHQKTLLT